MNYKEFIEYCEKKNINPEGVTVWATDIRMSGGDQYIRNVRAVEGIVTHRDNVNKNIYYADYAIIKMGKRGPTKQVIAFYDNTGFRSYTGTSINVYFTKEEAIEEAISQLKEIEEYYDSRIKFETRNKERVAKEQSELKSLLSSLEN